MDLKELEALAEVALASADGDVEEAIATLEEKGVYPPIARETILVLSGTYQAGQF